jgi:16S rRNA (cytidine1402-2'-O)-methyltransferase
MNYIKPVDLAPGLYLVATPIGNLRDITLRALDVLAAADFIVCEDTRVTGKLLNAYEIKKKMLPYNDHNAPKQRGPVVEALAAGGRVAMVSDAGTPLVSDPGFKLVRDCLDLGIPVTALPGANAPLTALQLSGLPSDKFSFLGFLPPKSAARKKLLGGWKNSPAPLIVFETGPRLADSLADMKEALGDRPAAVVRELTKLFEESRRGLLSELLAAYEEEGPPKGEIVVVIGGAPEEESTAEDVEALLQKAMETMSVKDAAAFVAAQTGRPKKEVYEAALRLRTDD